MSKKIIAFGASNSRASINKRLASFAAAQIQGVSVEVLDLNDFEMPIYSIDRERESGIPVAATQFKAYIKEANGVVISFAEHNGAYTAAFKNIMDWMSRIEGSTWEHKPMLLLSTSPGKRGGKSVLELATNSFRFSNNSPIASFSLPSFKQNFSEDEGIKDAQLAEAFQEQLKLFVEAVSVG